jgi:hypothetical protein
VSGVADPESFERHSLTDAEILRCVVETVRVTVLPAIVPSDDGARAAARRIAGHEVVGMASIACTLYDDVLPAVAADQEWARAATVQLIGLVRYAACRDRDRTQDRLEELELALGELAGNPIVADAWSGDGSQQAVMCAAGAALAAAVRRDDAAADEVRARLRPILVRHLDDELAATAPLVDAFRGKLDG